MKADPLALAIETSCDETAVALLRGRGSLLCSLVCSQVEIHRRYGGVVPEVASRNHLLAMRPLVDAALDEAGVCVDGIDLVAATRGPGLASSLLVGLSCAKALAVAAGKPFHGVNHLEGHLLSPFFGRPGGIVPALSLVVSGGHTLLVDLESSDSYRVLGRTRDDAAGEAFDKVARLLGLPYPGGPEIERRARLGNPAAFELPRGMLDSGDDDFSFSGLKTAIRYLLPEVGAGQTADLCASFQSAVVDVLVGKTMAAARRLGRRHVALSGGVSCNRALREAFETACGRQGVALLVAPPSLCTDNAAMIAYAAMESFLAGHAPDLGMDVDPNLGLETV